MSETLEGWTYDQWFKELEELARGTDLDVSDKSAWRDRFDMGVLPEEVIEYEYTRRQSS